MEHHSIAPFYDKDSKILILGSFPSIKSRKAGFYYYHPQNRFWKVLSAIFEEELPDSITAKKEFLRDHHIALFDVCKTCSIKGSSDAKIKEVTPNDLDSIINNSNIKEIYLNGKTAYNLYNKFLKDKTKIEGIYLPSTSPANATFSLEDLIECYSIVKNNVNK